MPALAELAVVTVPIGVTNAGEAHLSIEASSGHVAIQVIGPSLGPTGAPMTKVSVRVFGYRAPAALSSFDAIFRTSITENALRAANGPAELGVAIIDRSFKTEVQAFPVLPDPSVRWTIRLQGSVARDLLTTLETEGESGLSYDAVQARAIDVMAQVLPETGVTTVNSAGERAALPVRTEGQTAMHWLYSVMRQYGGVSVCPLSTGHRPGAEDPSPWSLYRAALGWLAETLPESSAVRIMDASRLALYRYYPPYRNEVIANLVTGLQQAPQAISFYGDFALLGDIDPVVVDIARCAGHRAVQGEAVVLRSVRARSVAYDEADRMIAKLWADKGHGADAPRFFAAASSVTRLVGLGAAEALAAYDIDSRSGLIAGVASIDARIAGCEGLGSGDILPDPPAREALRDINMRLFDFVNLPVMRALYARPGQLAVTKGPREVAIGSVDKGWTPTPALVFDLRMVLHEQSAVENLLMRHDLSDESLASLTRSQRALACSAVLGAASAVMAKESVPGVIASVDAALSALAQQGAVPGGAQSFANYWWRVATGMAYVLLLHGEDPSRLPGILRYVTTEGAKAARSDVPDDLAILAERVRSVAAQALSRDLERTVNLFLAPDLAEVGLLTCTPEQDALMTEPLQTAVSVADRAQLLVGFSGGASAAYLTPLAQVFELTPGGALRKDATLPQMTADRVLLCAALADRRKLLAAAAQGTVLPLPGLPAEAATTGLAVVEGSGKLRAELARLSPFARWRGAPGAADSAEDVIARLQDAAQAEAVYSADLALIARATALPALRWAALFPDMDRAAAQQLVRASLPADGPDSASAAARTARVAETRDKVRDTAARLAVAIDPAAKDATEDVAQRFGSEAGFGPMLYADAPLEVRDGSDPVARGAHEVPLLGNLLFVQITPTGDTLSAAHPQAGAPEHRLTLMLRRPRALADGLASAAGGQSAPDADVADRIPLTSADTVLPLGFYLDDIHLGADGQLGLGTVLAGVAAFESNPAQTAVALRALGLPEFLAASRVEPQISFKNGRIDTLTLAMDLNVLGISLGGIKVALLTGGKTVPIDDALAKAVQDRLDASLTRALTDAGAGLAGLQLPEGEAAFAAAPLRIGLIRGPEGEAIRHHLDWKGRTLTLTLGLLLEARDPATQTTQHQIKAEAEVLISPKGIAVRSFDFAPESVGELEKLPNWVLARLGLDADQMRALTGGLSIMPEFDGKTFGLRVRAQMAIEDCNLPVDEVIPLDAAAIESKLRGLAETLGAQAATCLAGGVIDRVTDAIDRNEIDLFGITLKTDLQGLTPAEVRAQAKGGRTVPLRAVVEGDWVNDCDLALDGRTLSGIKLVSQGDALKLDLGGMTAVEQENLGAVLLCRIQTLVPVGDWLLLSNARVGETGVSAEVTLQKLPYLGAVPLGRIPFDRLNEDVAKDVLARLTGSASALLADHLSKRLQGQALTLDGIGRLRFDANNSVSIVGDLENLRVVLRGALTIDAFDLSVTVTIDPATGDIDIKTDNNLAAVVGPFLQDTMQGLLADLSTGVQVEVDPLSFGPLDDYGRTWGLVIGAKAGFDLLGEELSLKVDRVTITDTGIEVPEQVTASLSTPILVYSPPPVFMTNTTLTLHTPDAPEPGLVAAADLTVGEASLARVLRFAVEADLRDLEQLRIAAVGRLILVDRLPIMMVKATLDLRRFAFSFDGRTDSRLEDVFSAVITGKASGEEALVEVASKLSVLGINLSDSTLSICASSKDCSATAPSGLRFSSASKLLIGDFGVGVRMRHDLGDPQASGGLKLRVFGWDVGGTQLNLSLSEVKLILSVLGIDLSISAPTIELMSPDYIASILESLFEIRLEDLVNADLTKIRIAAIGRGGEVSTANAPSEGADGPPGEGGEDAPLPAPPDVDKDPERQPNEAAPVAKWGQTVDAYVCMKMAGREPFDRFESGVQGARVFVRGWKISTDGQMPMRAYYYRQILDEPKSFIPWDPQDDFLGTNFWDELVLTYPESSVLGYDAVDGQPAVPMLCSVRGGVAQVTGGQRKIGSARQNTSFSFGTCPRYSDPNGNPTEPDLQLTTLPDERFADFAHAGLPVLCLPGGGMIASDYYLERDRTHIRVMFKCPYLPRVAPPVRDSVYFQRVCGANARPLMIPLSELGDPPDATFKKDNKVGLTAFDELDLTERIIRPHLLGQKAMPRSDRVELKVVTDDGTSFAAELRSNEGVVSILTTDAQGVLRPLTVAKASEPRLYSLMIDTRGDHAFPRALLSRWLNDDRRPRIGYDRLSTADRVVLLVEGFLNVEILTFDGAKIDAVQVHLPDRIPEGVVDQSVTEDMAITLLEQLLPHVVGLGPGPWQAVRGYSFRRDTHLWSFIGPPNPQGVRDLRIHRWDGQNERSIGDPVCMTDADLAALITSLLAPPPEQAVVQADVQAFLTRPDLWQDRNAAKRSLVDDLDRRMFEGTPCQ